MRCHAAGIDLRGAKHPLEVGLEPDDQRRAQGNFIGIGSRDLRLAFEDALAGGVAQVGNPRGFAVLGHRGLAVAVGGVVVESVGEQVGGIVGLGLGV